MKKPTIKLNPLKKTAVSAETQENYNELMRVFESGGDHFGNSRDLPTKNYHRWGDRKEETWVGIRNNQIGYANEKFYRDANFKMLKYEDFYAQQPALTTEKRAEINAYFESI